ncbi:hypothetical protein KOR34_27930 [Posidoniimonas corsicana]|uniref:Uncharacterized protein n=1 Tax=Posidoniimonas corsicana TaxID=1938618 RepID=A0A5C5VIW1_9BACT|nr:hypothetical protein [Posidoniimonas corsicana]TWT37829.1 hypothetical protein KOR34_27930 [Posidoniimonas corsicana]
MQKYLFSALTVAALTVLPTAANADGISAERQADAQAVADVLGLGSGDFQVLTADEAQQVRGTGGLLSLHRLHVRANARVKARVNVLNVVKVKARVGARVRVR